MALGVKEILLAGSEKTKWLEVINGWMQWVGIHKEVLLFMQQQGQDLTAQHGNWLN